MLSKLTPSKSYTFLLTSLLVTITMLLLDPLATATSEAITPALIILILVGNCIAILLAILTVLRLPERKAIPITALILTICNSIIIAFFLYIGFNFA